MRAAGLAVRTAVATYPADGRSAEALIGRASALLRGPDADGDRGPVLKSETMRKLYRLAERAAGGRTASGLINVLILGETGAGKEVLADWIHRHSPRASGPLVCINCAAHLRDRCWRASCSATRRARSRARRRPSRACSRPPPAAPCFSTRSATCRPALQTKLLRALENREVTRVGGLAARAIDVRFMAATNHDLEPRSRARRFRQDLYFRLNGISLTIPPLRERPDEIEPLARRFIADAAAAAKRRPPRLSPEALELLGGYAWPGNIRELRNVVERALVLCEDGEITPEHLPLDKLRLPRAGAGAPRRPRRRRRRRAPADASLTPAEAAERQRILELLAEHGGNQTRVAKKLGMARGTLIERLKRYGIKRPQVDD